MNKAMISLVAVTSMGYQLKAYADVSSGGALVLVDRGTELHPFVTWRINDDGDRFHGHYHQTMQEGLADFVERLK